MDNAKAIDISLGRAAASLFCLFGVTAFAQEGMQMPPARVETAIAETREMSPVVDIPGTVVSLNDSRIAAEVEGVLTSLAEVGDAVGEGQVIARIDPRLMEVEFARAKANVSRLESEFEYRERQLARTEELATLNNASKTLLDEARAQRDQSMHQLADARATLEHARGDLARSKIRAAFAGHIVERLASVGEYVTVGADVLRLVDTLEVEIALPAPIGLAKFIQPGMQVTVAGDGVQRQHTVRAVVPVGDAVSRQVEVRLSARDGDWLVGTPVQVSLPSDAPVTTVAVPRDALIERSGRRHIFKIDADGKAEQIDADVRAMIGLWVGIANGVSAGDQVVVRGGERLMPGQAVEIVETLGSR